MPDPIFLDKTKPPTEAELKQTIGEAFSLWQEVKNFINSDIDPSSLNI